MSGDAFAAWERGDLTDQQALHALATGLGELESELGSLEAERKALRGQLERVVARLGGKGQAAGFELTITEGGESVSYDREGVDALIVELSASGDRDFIAIAQRLGGLRRVTQRSGSLRVTKAKDSRR